MNHQRSLLFLFLFIFIHQVTISQESGSVRLLGHYVPPQGGSYVSGCWGWTDTLSGREYAILGSYSGTSFVEITNTGSLVERAFVPGVSSSWRELQTWGHYAYAGSEGGGGVQIMDMSYLPDSVHLVQGFIYSNAGGNTARTHTIHIRDGYLYVNGGGYKTGGIVIFSLADPEHPSYRGEYETRYVHDCFVRNDTIYAANINNGGVDIISVTNKTSPTFLYRFTYPGAGTHNTATTKDGQYLLTTDEIGSTAKTLKIWDLRNPPTFPMVAEYVGSPTAIVHNVFVKGDLAIMSYYTKGLKVVDISNPEEPIELGGYDTYPSSDVTDYSGAWSTYPFFPSGKIIIGDMVTGLYVVDLNVNAPKPPALFSGYSDYQTPNSISLTWNDPTQYNSGSPLSNFKIHIYRGATFIAEVDSGVQTYIDGGRTLHQSYSYNVYAVAGAESSTVVGTSAYAGGHPTPNAPSEFSALDSSTGAFLSWRNPSRQLDNTPLNDLAYILIYRNGVLYDSIAQTSADTGQVRTYLDATHGFHSYYVKARDNESPVHYSAATSTISAYGQALLLYSEDFESAFEPLQHTGQWDTTSAVAASGTHSITDSPGGFGYNPSTTTFLSLPPVILGTKPMLEFKHVCIVAFGDFAFLEISKDQGQTYSTLKVYNLNAHTEWQDGYTNQGDWFTEKFDLSAYENKTVYVRFRLVANATNEADGWYLDDIYIGPSSVFATKSFTSIPSWNLLSLPVKVDDAKISTLFPSALTNAFYYNNGYTTVDSLQFGSGYWMRFDSAETFPISGTTYLKDTITVSDKWNIIGSLSEPVSVSKITSIPSNIINSSFYGFDGSYSAVQTLEPGKAYWVKVSQAGKLILSGFSYKSNINDQENVTGKTENNSLTFTDAFGNKQTLYFGSTEGAGSHPNQYELPPLPPQGAFDVRFLSQKSAEFASPGSSESFPILIQSEQFPVTLEWNVSSKVQGGWTLETGENTIAIKGKGVARLTSGSVTLKSDGTNSNMLPAEFALLQNYPNPFNPSTQIRYQLPISGIVTIKVYDVLGKEVSTLVNGLQEAGSQTVTFDGSGLSSGIFHLLMNVNDIGGKQLYRGTQKLILMK